MSGDIWSDDLNSTAPLVVSKCSWLYPSARRVRGSSSFPCISESTVRLPSATKRRWPAGSFASVRPPAASRAGLAELTRRSDRRPRPPTEYSVSAAPVCGDAEVPASPQSGIAMVRFLKRPAASLHDEPPPGKPPETAPRRPPDPPTELTARNAATGCVARVRTTNPLPAANCPTRLTSREK